MNTSNQFQALEEQQIETTTAERATLGRQQENNNQQEKQDKVSTKKWVEERFRKEKEGNPDTPQHQSERGKDQVVEVSTTDTQQQGNQLEATDSQHIKGGDDNNNQQHHTEEDHQSTTTKHDSKQGENVVELDRRDEEVVSQLQDHKGEGEQLQAHTDLGDNANNILQTNRE